MKRLIPIILLALLYMTIAGCGTKSLGTTGLDTNSNSKEDLINKAVSKFYLTGNPGNKGELKVYITKPFQDKYLVLAEKYSGDGHRFTNLFLLDEKFDITAWTSGEVPLSMCFSINKVDFDGNTILFGTFNDSKWIPKQDKKITVQINKIDVKFLSNQSIKEDVAIEKGYLLVLNSISDVEQFNLYNKKDEIQSNVEDLEEYGRTINQIQFLEFKDK